MGGTYFLSLLFFSVAHHSASAQIAVCGHCNKKRIEKGRIAVLRPSGGVLAAGSDSLFSVFLPLGPQSKIDRYATGREREERNREKAKDIRPAHSRHQISLSFLVCAENVRSWTVVFGHGLGHFSFFSLYISRTDTETLTSADEEKRLEK